MPILGVLGAFVAVVAHACFSSLIFRGELLKPENLGIIKLYTFGFYQKKEKKKKKNSKSETRCHDRTRVLEARVILDS